jgi:hypothetical protein
VLVAPLRLVVLQRQRLTQGNSLEVVPVLRCLVRNFRVVADVARQLKTPKAVEVVAVATTAAAADEISAT